MSNKFWKKPIFWIAGIVTLGIILKVSGTLTFLAGFASLMGCDRFEYQDFDFDSSERRTCYSQVLGSLIRKEGPALTVKVLDSYRTTPQGKKIEESRCHSLGHDMGSAAVLSGYSSDEILEGCGNYCIGGCLNGAAHAVVLSGKDTPQIEEFCRERNFSKEIIDSCYHGIGHAFIELSQGDVASSVKKCSQLESRQGRYQCSHATFMDPALLVLSPNHLIPLTVSNFCSQFKEEEIAQSCYAFSGFMAYSRDLNVISSFTECTKVPENSKEECRLRIGEVLLFRFKNNLGQIGEECGKDNNVGALSCLRGAIDASVHGPSGAFGSEGKKICLGARDNLRGECFQILGSVLESQKGKIRKEEFCKELDEPYKQNCFGEALN